MLNHTKHYINGEWVDSTGSDTIEVINPATEEVMGKISSGTEEDVNRAVQAAKEAFPSFSKMSVDDRIKLLEDIAKEYEKRKDDLVKIMTEELGAPITKSEQIHYQMGLAHFKQAAEELKTFQFTEERDNSYIIKEPIGVSGLITPWNFPTNQISTKLASALAAGSTLVVKPASQTPFAAIILAEIFDKAGVPKGVFNLVNGSGSIVGEAISSHPDIDFVSFTGSGAVGSSLMKNAAEDIKNVSLELGGKSPLVILKDADVKEAAKTALTQIATNTGQVCAAATRVIVPEEMHDDFVKAMKELVGEFPVGDPQDKNTFMGPQVSEEQWKTVQSYIKKGEDEGATLAIGGPGRPDGIVKGFFSKITVFTNVQNNMTIAQEEIFGPVMSVITYKDIDEAIEIANDTVYGLAGYIVGNDKEELKKVASSIRAGQIRINNSKSDISAPFGGFKQSGIGREWGNYGIEEFLEPKAIMGMPSN
ncbi:aldehyde dehydrogenase family protein [Psychrobacillus lasiicapitis]|uniref:Aldehyde dehydrogenase n=1 Tax=Psychrobacillus lasiicapitis TaxID=1636719 RepID=A0A544TI10_9BACI|nr:aldehyde dehydrogenase family protein [Psychrobacillus lasiicapitis]TQR17096.1 aldehyde dehydrogenase family protein [Psychrobacillus lasiicapitis]GGA24545.1 putative aldehyde dehydrogenase [Psychrobacillus lasiicapitis]